MPSAARTGSMLETVPFPAFATLPRRYRQAAGPSQEELAARAGLSVRTIGDLERGASHAPRKDTVALLAQALALAPPERAALAQAAADGSSGRSAGFGLLFDAHALLAERELRDWLPHAACARLAPLLEVARQEVWGGLMRGRPWPGRTWRGAQ